MFRGSRQLRQPKQLIDTGQLNEIYVCQLYTRSWFTIGKREVEMVLVVVQELVR